MKTETHTLDQIKVAYPADLFGDPEKALFLDIETTGLTAHSSDLYLIGCVYYRDGLWHTIQWMAETLQEQAGIIEEYLSFSADYSLLIHFNGNHFDLPYLKQKCLEFGIDHPFDSVEGIDLYRRISSMKPLLNIPDCKQRTLELYLGVDREDPYTGGELIDLYREYTKSPSPEISKILLLHNFEDLRGMLTILPMLSYQAVLTLPLKAKKVQANRYRDVNGNTRMELLITCTLPVSVPKPLSSSASGCYVKLGENEATIRVPVYEGELKYFYANYKDYYYLPEEDLALHKSVATFVDKDHRVQAGASNCYTRKESVYLRQWDHLFTPFFKKEYNSHEIYFELTDELKRNRNAFGIYASHVLNMIAFHSGDL